ncbi:hypothetical protein HJG60_008125 [Phyllostomus discolor]|uniref:Uncharacterized protein n=1 Tax=Phyllostomus discolor TaxID=89673 RepID=A0A833Z6F9_9CHIR|nr:hypothetical protein HJG60_008125 [Phyllostomus discolor]
MVLTFRERLRFPRGPILPEVPPGQGDPSGARTASSPQQGSPRPSVGPGLPLRVSELIFCGRFLSHVARPLSVFPELMLRRRPPVLPASLSAFLPPAWGCSRVPAAGSGRVSRGSLWWPFPAEKCQLFVALRQGEEASIEDEEGAGRKGLWVSSLLSGTGGQDSWPLGSQDEAGLTRDAPSAAPKPPGALDTGPVGMRGRACLGMAGGRRGLPQSCGSHRKT